MTILGKDLESPKDERGWGSGWLSGTLALALACAGLGTVLCLRYPQLLTVPQARTVYDERWIRPLLHLGLVGSFSLAIVSIVLRKQKVLGFTAISLVFIAVAFGGSHTQGRADVRGSVFSGMCISGSTGF